MSLHEEILQYSRQDTMAPLSNWFSNLLSELTDQGIYTDKNELEETGRRLVQELQAYKKQYHINDVVIGMSGGVDSALTAALFKQAGYTVWGFTLPIHQKIEETERGMEACRALDIIHKQIDLTDPYEFMLEQTRMFDPEIDNEDAKIRRGNLRVRLRMMTLYNMASVVRGFVASTDNFSELAAGFWTLHGDVGDVAPIQSLSKSWEVPRLAEIMKVPKETVFAVPTDGLGISKGDEDQFGFSYLEFDLVLLKLCQADHIETRQQALEYLQPDTENIDKVNRILDRIAGSTFKRSNPYNLYHPLQSNRYPGLRNIDNALWR